MNKSEAIKIMINGGKVRTTHMEESSYVYFKGGSFYFHYNGLNFHYNGFNDKKRDINQWASDSWEEYKSPEDRTGRDLIKVLCYVYDDGDYNENIIVEIKEYDCNQYYDVNGDSWDNAKPVPLDVLKKYMAFWESL